jgi:nucleoside-triphosphatase THEP1
MGSIILISGDYDSGKTTRLIKVFNNQKTGEADGFACVKMRNSKNEVIGYALRHLSTMEDSIFIFDRKFYDDSFKEYFEFERFIFSIETLRYAERIIEKAIKNPKIHSVFIDEIGAIELSGMGFCEILLKLINSDKNAYLCVNERHVEEVTKKFRIHSYYRE